jgi:hypothetical protein
LLKISIGAQQQSLLCADVLLLCGKRFLFCGLRCYDGTAIAVAAIAMQKRVVHSFNLSIS